MLTNLDFLEPGNTFPPKCEKDRILRYEINRKLFEGNHTEIYEEQFKRIERVIGNFRKIISYPVILNFQKLISVKTADLLLGEPPKIMAGENGSSEQESIEQIIENTDLINTAYENTIDISRFGDGIFVVYEDEGKGMIDVAQPSFWYPVVDENNLKKIKYHVLAWKYTYTENGRKEDRLKVRIHDKGSYEEREYLLASGIDSNYSYKCDTKYGYDAYNKYGYGTTIERQIGEAETVFTGLDDFAVIHTSNLMTSDRITGFDDYADIDTIIAEIEVRVSQIARILDKHAAPSVQGPASALEKDPATGEWKLKMGNYFSQNSKDDPEVKYITWDANLSANFEMIEKLINMLYTISEMGSAIFGDLSAKTGQIPSGSALRRLMISPLAKVNRIRMRFDPALKKAIKLASQLGGEGITDLSNEKISIVWQDGLPADPLEEAKIMQIRTGNKSTMSVNRGLQQYDNMSQSQAEMEIETIEEEEMKSNPMLTTSFSRNTELEEG